VKGRDRAVRLAWGGKERALAVERARPEAAAREGGAARTRTALSAAGFPLVAEATDALAHDGTGGALFQGDNGRILRDLTATLAEKVTLVYLDPPFLTGRVHKAIHRGRKPEDRKLSVAFDDRWEDRAAYLESLAERIVLARRLLAPHGSVVIHVDPKTSHYVKVLCDEIFGDDCFASEIVWRYRRWPSKTANFQRVHDVLLRYRKDASVEPRWNTLYEPLAASTLATWGTKKQRAVVGQSGRRLRSSTTEESSRGVPMGDVWEIGVIAPVARERTGYPSQKPEALLERIVHALSDPGDLVVDPYMGSGTTLAVAARLGRQYLGIDASDVAIRTAKRRLSALEKSVPAPPESTTTTSLEVAGRAAYARAGRHASGGAWPKSGSS
jgi:site-specific DNA-methyltransferase (adenine-specific)